MQSPACTKALFLSDCLRVQVCLWNLESNTYLVKWKNCWLSIPWKKRTTPNFSYHNTIKMMMIVLLLSYSQEEATTKTTTYSISYLWPARRSRLTLFISKVVVWESVLLWVTWVTLCLWSINYSVILFLDP